MIKDMYFPIKINNSVLSSIIADPNNKKLSCHQHKELIQEFSCSLTNYFNFFATECSEYEVAQLISANQHLLSNKSGNNIINYTNRQVVMVELGAHCSSLSYKHPCIVINEVNDKVFVVPCTSGPAAINSLTGILYDGYMEGDIDDGFAHLTTLLLKESKFIDKSQILYAIKEPSKPVKLKKVTNDFFKKINDALFNILFEGKEYKMKKLEESNSLLQDANSLLQESNFLLIEKNKIINENLNKLQLEYNNLKKHHKRVSSVVGIE